MRSLLPRVRRALAPAQFGGRPLLENVVFPLYSTAGIDNTNLPAELNFFGYAKGQAVPGAGNFSGGTSSLWHTNMETPGALAQPKVFTITGIRCFFSQLQADAANRVALADAPQAAAAAGTINNWNDPLLALWSGVLRLTVGPKTYTNHPLWMFPSNLGYGGVASQSVVDETPALNTVIHTAVHGVGQYFDFSTYPVVIAAQQSFGVQVSWTWATNPSIGVDRAMTIFLDGIMSREVS